MRKQIEIKIEIGDANYVKPGELFGELSSDGTVLTAIKRRKNDLTFETLVETPTVLPVLEDEKSVEISISEISSDHDLDITPTSGNDAMKKVIVKFTD
jgi:hypothetical protein